MKKKTGNLDSGVAPDGANTLIYRQSSETVKRFVGLLVQSVAD